MEGRLKQRIVGAVVIAALAIILLPMLFDGSPEERAKTRRVIPSPEIRPVAQVDGPAMLVELEQMQAESAEKIPKEVESDANPQPLSLDANGLPIGWSLQVGSFSQRENATNFKQRSRDTGFSTYVTETAIGTETSYRVMVGPMLHRGKLEELSNQIETSFDVKGRIIRYRVEDDKGLFGG